MPRATDADANEIMELNISTDTRPQPQDPVCVLYVDDSRLTLDLTADVLEAQPQIAEVRTLADPTVAAERISRSHDELQCVVSDYDMPVMDGLELCDRIRNGAAELPFVLYTGYERQDFDGQLRQYGVDAYVRKGAGVGQYEQLLQEVLELTNQSGE